MGSLSRETLLRPAATVEFRPIDSGAMLVNVGTGDCFQLNRVGAETWTLLVDGRPIREIVDALAARYAVAPAILESDVFRLLTDLLKAGLLAGLEAMPPEGRDDRHQGE